MNKLKQIKRVSTENCNIVEYRNFHAAPMFLMLISFSGHANNSPKRYTGHNEESFYLKRLRPKNLF